MQTLFSTCLLQIELKRIFKKKNVRFECFSSDDNIALIDKKSVHENFFKVIPVFLFFDFFSCVPSSLSASAEIREP